MNWDYIIIATAIAASLAYLARRRALQKRMRAACGCASSDCACCTRISAKHHGFHHDS